MNRRSALALVTSLSILAVALTAFSAPPHPAASGAALPMDPAHLAQLKALYSEKCSACHNLPDAAGESKTRAQWQRTVNTMLTRYNASQSISPAEAAQIVDYLATFAPPQGTRGGPGGDPWATDSTDVWTEMPSASRVFNFVDAGSLSQFGMIGAGTAGPAPVWRLVTVSNSPDGTAAQVRLAKPSPDRFGLLMDRQDQARNLDVQVRFHIVSGRVTPAVGIVFGFSGPKRYSVLAYNQTRNDLSLIQIADPMHTTLQQTPIDQPAAGGAQTAAQMPPALASGWHTLRLLVKDGQVRGWLDHTKRISIADPTYQGGKIGLWAQGDTVAAFQDWTVDIYDATSPPAGGLPA